MQKPIYFSKEDKYDDIIKKYKIKYDKEFGVEVGINNIKGIIAQESMFNADWKRYEPKVKDTSMGLMQILTETARGVGWDGKENLLDPDVNLKYGIKYFYIQFKRYKKYTDAYAGYNAGSVKRDPKTHKYINQYYVDIVSAFSSFYYYRDIKKDYDMAEAYKQRIKKMRSEELKREIESKKTTEQDFITLIFIVVVLGILIWLISSKE